MAQTATCPFCKLDFEDLLSHLVFTHNIQDSDQYLREVKKEKEREDRRIAFNAYVLTLQNDRRRKVISAEQYRESISKWLKEHPLSNQEGGS